MTSPGSFLWISETEAAALVDMDAAIAALDETLRLEAAGDAANMTKTHAAWPAGSLHAIGATLRRDGIAVTKTWVNTPRGSTPLVLLFDTTAGRLLAVLEAFALGQLRTAAISGIATRALAREDARALAIIGAGEQALPKLPPSPRCVRSRRCACSAATPAAARRLPAGSRTRSGSRRPRPPRSPTPSAGRRS
jgi:ornithine cyclodeaminase